MAGGCPPVPLGLRSDGDGNRLGQVRAAYANLNEYIETPQRSERQGLRGISIILVLEPSLHVIHYWHVPNF